MARTVHLEQTALIAITEPYAPRRTPRRYAPAKALCALALLMMGGLAVCNAAATPEVAPRSPVNSNSECETVAASDDLSDESVGAFTIIQCDPTWAWLEGITYKQIWKGELQLYGFDVDGADLTPEHERGLDSLVSFLNSDDVVNYRLLGIYGEASATGEEVHNQELSETRADRVYSSLIFRLDGASGMEPGGIGDVGARAVLPDMELGLFRGATVAFEYITHTTGGDAPLTEEDLEAYLTERLEAIREAAGDDIDAPVQEYDFLRRDAKGVYALGRSMIDLAAEAGWDHVSQCLSSTADRADHTSFGTRNREGYYRSFEIVDETSDSGSPQGRAERLIGMLDSKYDNMKGKVFKEQIEITTNRWHGFIPFIAGDTKSGASEALLSEHVRRMEEDPCYRYSFGVRSEILDRANEVDRQTFGHVAYPYDQLDRSGQPLRRGN